MEKENSLPTTFTPVFDEVIRFVTPAKYEKGWSTIGIGSVFGAMFRYAQNGEEICTASHQKIADRCGLSVPTVRRSIDFLKVITLITDLTPDRRNDTHRYKINHETLQIIIKGWRAMCEEVAHHDQPGCSPRSGGLITMSDEETSKRQSIRGRKKPASRKSKKLNNAEGGRSSGKKLPIPAAVAPSPAVSIYEEETEQAATNAQARLIDAAVELFDQHTAYQWRELVKAWLGRGWSAGNVAGILERWKNSGYNQSGKDRIGSWAKTEQCYVEYVHHCVECGYIWKKGEFDHKCKCGLTFAKAKTEQITADQMEVH